MVKTPKKFTRLSPPKPSRPRNLAQGRWLGDFGDLSDAEKRLVYCSTKGQVWTSEGYDSRNPIIPEIPTPNNEIRAEIIRYLALGGDNLHPTHEVGVMARCAWIKGVLNLHQCRAHVRVDLRYCYFEQEPDLTAAQIPELAMKGCHLPGLKADRIKVAGSVFLREGFKATGEVRLLGAQIGGSLFFTNATFINRNGRTINADRVKISGSILMNGSFLSEGEVRLIAAEVGSDFSCIKGQFINNDGFALRLGKMNVSGSIILKSANVSGIISLNATRVNSLIDDISCWGKGGHILDGLNYARIVGPTDAVTRIAWLQSQRKEHLNNSDWRPQPWEQMIRVLREMGHSYEAAEIAMAKQDQMRRAGKIVGPARKTLHWSYGRLAGYGHRPIRTLGAMIAVWLLCSVAFWAGADRYAAFGPNNPAITSPTLYPDAEKLCGHGNEPGKQRWTECAGVPDEYTTFQPFIYSLDVILPLVDLQQETDWAPIAEGPTGKDLLAGVILRWLMWFEILFGWAMSLMLVAVLGRLVEKD